MKITVPAFAAALLAAAPAFAHHAFNMYENDRYVTMTGTVKTWTWKNPHAMIDFVTDKGETWSVECSSPNIIGRRGWSMDSLHVGDHLTLTLHPMKDGSKYGLTVSVITPKGATLKDKD